MIFCSQSFGAIKRSVFTYMTDDYYVGSFDGTRMFVGNKDCAFALTICVDYDFNRLPY